MAAFDYDLPEEAIAQHPADPRDSARLLVATDGDVRHAVVHDLPELLQPGDLLVANDTRVLPARLRLRKATGGAAEVLLVEPCGPDPGEWDALVRPGRRLPAGCVLVDPAGDAIVEVGERTGDGTRRVRLLRDPSTCGSVPLPPYLHEGLADPERYQTVYADRPGSVAAPTAGLHLTRELIGSCRGAADPLRHPRAGRRSGHLPARDGGRSRRSPDAQRGLPHPQRDLGGVPGGACSEAGASSRWARPPSGRWRPPQRPAASAAGRTLFIRPPYQFAVADLLLTNFHLPALLRSC